jgi:hypothetical protein
MKRAMMQDDSKVCEKCGNVYRVELLKEGDDWDYFGFSYCPFCGDVVGDVMDW